MDYPSANFLEYWSYLLSISVVFNLNEILVCSIFIPCCNNERSNGALNVVAFSILLSSADIGSYHSSQMGLLTKSPMWYGVVGGV